MTVAPCFHCGAPAHPPLSMCQGDRTDVGKCCPFKTTPGRFAGEWTTCIHGLQGRRAELVEQLRRIDQQIQVQLSNGTKRTNDEIVEQIVRQRDGYGNVQRNDGRVDET